MSKLAVHMKKYKRSQINQLWKHNFRKNQNYGNKNIDHNRTANNVVYIEPKQTLYKDTKKRIEEAVTGRINSESVWLVESVIYAPEGISEAEQDRFYRDVLDWMAEKYGKENIISAVNHKDEYRSHCHIDLTPVTLDGRLSAKELIDRKSLTDMHTDLAAYLQERGHQVERGKRAKKGEKLISLSVNEYKERADQQKAKIKERYEMAKNVTEQLEKGNVKTAQRVLEKEVQRLKNAERERCR